MNESKNAAPDISNLRNVSISHEAIMDLAKKHFPFDVPNPGQIEAVVWAVVQFLAGEKHVIVQAPTGFGKSVFAIVVHKVLADLVNNFRSTIVTATIGLQDQYCESDRTIYDIRGRTNYSCPHNKGPYNSGQCRAMVRNGGCRKHLDCPYVIRRKRWCNEAMLRSSNFSFQIEACDTLCTKEENRANLIIIDECHEIDDAIVDHTTISIFPNMYKFTEELGFPQFFVGMKELLEVIEKYSKMEYFDTPDDLRQSCHDLHVIAEDIIEALEAEIEEGASDSRIEKLGDMLETIQSISDKLTLFGEAEAGAKWIVNEYSNNDESQMATIKPVFAWQVADYALFRKGDIFLHMSATICGIDEYASTLGLEKFQYGELQNPIPVDNRKVYVIPKFKMNAQFKDYPALANVVGKLIDRHAPHNGLVHCVSYALGNNIFQNLQNKGGAFIGRDRNEIVNEMARHKTGAVCISPSIVKGYDFKGDMSRFQIIAKVPFGYLGDPLIKLNSEYRSGWYLRKAILSIVQMCGRSVRGVDDYADTYIIDSNFQRVLYEGKQMNLFPQWFLDSIVEVKQG
ncbi:ATP-dependent helicase [Acinetobacter phage SH-Ab 15599]|nr:ATP-dependent helicase [Acinetobacter phage SH-Ab 15599]